MIFFDGVVLLSYWVMESFVDYDDDIVEKEDVGIYYVDINFDVENNNENYYKLLWIWNNCINVIIFCNF